MSPLLNAARINAARTDGAARRESSGNTRRPRSVPIGLVLLLIVSLFGAAPAAAAAQHGQHNHHDHHTHHTAFHDVLAAYLGTARYHHLPAASRAGYAAFPDGVPLHECIDEDIDLDDHDGKPAMGVHWVNGALLDDRLDAAHPEVLVFEPRHGRLHLVAVEYVVFASAWGSPRSAPRLFGRALQYVPAPNRYDLPAFYEIHAWLWKFNPAGTFANMNPRVDCADA